MPKIDLKKELKVLYSASAKNAVVVNVPAMNFLMVDGKGNPNTSPEYVSAIQALYSLSYTLKFMIKNGREAIDYTVMPLEGLWWSEDPGGFSPDDKSGWLWTAMIMQPEYVTDDLFRRAATETSKKKDAAILSKARLSRFHEGLSAQIMHTGPYGAEAPTIEKLHGFINGRGYELRDKHHEIYLSNPERSDPQKLKTIIRQPIR